MCFRGGKWAGWTIGQKLVLFGSVGSGWTDPKVMWFIMEYPFIMLMQLSEELLEKQRTETSMQEEVETLKDMLRSEKQNLEELSSKHNELRSLCQEKESALQVTRIVLNTSI